MAVKDSCALLETSGGYHSWSAAEVDHVCVCLIPPPWISARHEGHHRICISGAGPALSVSLSMRSYAHSRSNSVRACAEFLLWWEREVDKRLDVACC